MPAPRSADPAEALGLPELLRIMDVATALRQDRELVQQQLNHDDLKQRLRERLLAGSGVTGEAVTPAEVDAAIERYFQNRNTFAEPPRTFALTLAHLYVRRRPLARWTTVAAAAALGLWLVLGWAGGSGRGSVPSAARRTAAVVAPEVERDREIANLRTAVAGSLEALRAATTDPTARAEADRLSQQAEAFEHTGGLDRLRAIRAELGTLEARVNQNYTVRIVSRPGQKSGIDRYFTDADGRRVSGYYLIVEAVAADGRVLPRPVRNIETGRTEEVSAWAERVPKEVYDRIAADKRKDGIVDEDVFAVKPRGQLDERITLPGPDGPPLSRLGQITQW